MLCAAWIGSGFWFIYFYQIWWIKFSQLRIFLYDECRYWHILLDDTHSQKKYIICTHQLSICSKLLTASLQFYNTYLTYPTLKIKLSVILFQVALGRFDILSPAYSSEGVLVTQWKQLHGVAWVTSDVWARSSGLPQVLFEDFKQKTFYTNWRNGVWTIWAFTRQTKRSNLVGLWEM